MKRGGIDVVVPFLGSAEGLRALVGRLDSLHLAEDDTLTVVDNTPGPARGLQGVLHAPERRSSYFARNKGAARGEADWILFLDADVQMPPDLVDRYFERAPAPDTAVLAGGMIDEPVESGSLAARYAMLRAAMSQGNTLESGTAYAQTANCAVRREAFEAVGGFRSHVRSGGDADLCFRLRAAGWRIEAREEAAVVHRNRRTLMRMLAQRARHGSGAAWLDREHPGCFPRERLVGLAVWSLRSSASAARAYVRGDRDRALIDAVDPLSMWAFELGRLVPNETGKQRLGRRRLSA